MDIAGALPYVKNFIVKPLMWLVILGGVTLFMLGVLWLKKRNALRFTGIEETEYGGVNTVPCGWLGIKWYAGGLWTTGRKVMCTNVGEIIEEFSEEDFIEVNGKRGFRFYRDPTNKKLFPLGKTEIKNKHLVASIPPAEYIDNALRIIDDANSETINRTTQMVQYAIWGLVVIASLIAIIVIVQMVSKAQARADATVLQAGATCLESAKSVCSTITSEIIKSRAP